VVFIDTAETISAVSLTLLNLDGTAEISSRIYNNLYFLDRENPPKYLSK
jgi:hypothetical protein